MYNSARGLRRSVTQSFLALVLLISPVSAQRPPDMKLNANANRQVVGAVVRAINKYYVSADIARQVDERLRQRVSNGEYDKITSAFDLIDALDNHTQQVSKDRHLALARGVLTTTSQAQGKLPLGTKNGFVTTRDNVKIHYLEAGPRLRRRVSSGALSSASQRESRNLPTVLFVPGWMTPGWIWELQIAHFAQHYRVVAMDPRSQGESSKPADGHYPAARARDIKSVVDQLKLAPVVIVGASSAVTEVVSYVDQFGTKELPGLVLVNGIAGRDYDRATLSGLLAYSNSLQIDRQKAADRFVRGLYKKPQSEDYIRRMVQATLRMPTNSAMALILGGIASDNRPALAKIDQPTLIVVARVGPWMQFYEDLQQRIRGARMEIFEEAGHALFVEEAIRFNALLDGFLNSLAAEARR